MESGTGRRLEGIGTGVWSKMPPKGDRRGCGGQQRGHQEPIEEVRAYKPFCYANHLWTV